MDNILNLYKKIHRAVAVVVICGMFTFFSYIVIGNKDVSASTANLLETSTIVEAKSANYVEPYTDDINGKTNEQSEILEDPKVEEKVVESKPVVKEKPVTQPKIEEKPVVEPTVPKNTEEKATVEVVNGDHVAKDAVTNATDKVKNLDQPVEIVYVSESEYEGPIPNEMNEVVIAMYHGVTSKVKNSDTVHRSVEGFKKDLQLLYDNGYRAITMEDLMTNNINVPAGYTPIVLTFDDGLSSSFSMSKDSNGNLVPREDCAVDLINDFNKKHPDFGTHAMFYVYTSQQPFRGAGTVDDAIDYLLKNGYEVGGHTYSHRYLSKMSIEEIQMEMGYSTGYISKHSDGFKAKYVAYPYGVMASDEKLPYLLKGKYEDFSYNFHSGVLAAPNSNTSTLVYSNKFDKYRVGRYRGTNNATYDLNWKVKNDAKNGKQFISDGDPNTVTILERDLNKVNLDTLKNKKLIVITK